MREKIISILIILFGFGLLSYPFFSNYLFEKSAGSTIKTYQDCDFEEMADKKIVEIYDKILEGNRVEKKFYRLNLLDEANMYFFVNATSKKEAFEIIKRHRNFSKVMNLDICEDDIEEVALEKLYEEE